MKSILIFSLFTAFCGHIFSQDLASKNGDTDSLKNLSFYIETAITNSPALKMYQMNIDKNELEMELLKFSWMREIYVTADTKYGNYGNANPIDQFNLGYGTGAFIRLPLTVFVGSAQRKKIAKLELESSIYQKEIIEEELKKLIIRQFNETLLKGKLIKIQIQAVDLSTINFKFAEEEFKAGNIHIDTYSRITEVYYTQKSILEKTINEYFTSFSLLKEISGL